MFWKSIIAGLSILSHWEVWVAIVLYMVINFTFLMITLKMSEKNKFGAKMVAGYFLGGNIVLHGILMGLMIDFLFPILLGGPSAASISEIIALLWPTIKICVIAIVVVTILSIIPFIEFIFIPGIQEFFEGVIIFNLISIGAINKILTGANIQGNVYPGFWASIGFLIITEILYMAVVFSLSLLSVLLENTVVGELIPSVIGPMLKVLVSIISLFIYSSYVRLSLMQLIGG